MKSPAEMNDKELLAHLEKRLENLTPYLPYISFLLYKNDLVNMIKDLKNE